MNYDNEPVAWMRTNKQWRKEVSWVKKEGFDTPLYTHSDQMGLAESIIVQQKLEIEALKLQLHTTLTNRDLRTYDGKTEINNEPLAWALRKAQEK